MNVREIAFHSLVTICKDEGYSNIVVSQTIQKKGLTDRDRRFYTELVYGTLRHSNYLDWIISQISSRKLAKLDPVCLAIIMLRNSIRRRQEFTIPTLEENALLHLALTYHQQEWLINMWMKAYGLKDTIALCQYFDRIPDLCLRTNTSRISRDALLKKLAEQGIQARKSQYAPEGIYLSDIPNINGLTVLKEGLAIIQDEPSQLVAHVVDPQPHEVILDVCAAPGGKTTHLAALGGPTCTVYGGDIYEHKLKLIEINASRLGLSNVRTILQNACTIGKSYAGKADRVLVDAPCSGLGILSHKIDLRWRKKPSDLKVLPPLQRRILESASQCVKPGGILVYSTCTIQDEENIQIVNGFLKNHPEFTLENAVPFCHTHHEGPCVQLLPQHDELDGFFIARMRRGE